MGVTHCKMQLSEAEQDAIAYAWRSFGVVCDAIARILRSLNNLFEDLSVEQSHLTEI